MAQWNIRNVDDELDNQLRHELVERKETVSEFVQAAVRYALDEFGKVSVSKLGSDPVAQPTQAEEDGQDASRPESAVRGAAEKGP